MSYLKNQDSKKTFYILLILLEINFAINFFVLYFGIKFCIVKFDDINDVFKAMITYATMSLI
ncbi:hypothetical protein AYL20_09470 [Acinetobacter venetianus]|nr:hypothetical protein AYL20_09470 [Acinetobacter venetianus]